MAWVKNIRRVVHRLGEALTEAVTLDAPSHPPTRWTPPAHGYGAQLIPPQEWQRRLRAHALRQEAERREEAEQRRRADEQFRRDLERLPVQCYFPPASVEPTGFPGLFHFLDDMSRRS